MSEHDSNWNKERRRLLMASGLSAGLAFSPVTLYAKANHAVPLDKYKPVYFNAHEWAFIMAATARLIPSEGDGPGAHETHVPVFIDQQLAGEYGQAVDWCMQGPHQPDASPQLGYQTPLSPAQLYREGIVQFNSWCVQHYQKSFTDLSAEQQDEALTRLEQGKVGFGPELRDFFAIFLGNTKEGYFADPMYGGNKGMQSWTYIGFPGARAAFKEWSGQHNVPYPLGPVSISGERA